MANIVLVVCVYLVFAPVVLLEPVKSQEKVSSRHKRDTWQLAAIFSSLTNGGSANIAAAELSDAPEEAAITAVFIDNLSSNISLNFIKYYEPTENRYRDQLPPSVLPGTTREGFSLSTLGGSRSLEAGAVWGIQDHPDLRLIAFWGAFRDRDNYLILSIGSKELEKELSSVDRTDKETLKEQCSKINDLIASGQIESVKHCQDKFCVIGSMGGAQQTEVNIHFIPRKLDFLDSGMRYRISNNQTILNQTLAIPNPTRSQCNTANVYALSSILLSVSALLAIGIVF